MMGKSPVAFFKWQHRVHGLQYYNEQSFQEAAHKLLAHLILDDVLLKDVEPQNEEALKLLAQAQLLDEAEQKKLVDAVVVVFKHGRGYEPELEVKFQNAMARWEYAKQVTNIWEVHFKKAAEEMARCLEVLAYYELDRINRTYPGDQYKRRFWTALMDKLSADNIGLGQQEK